MQVKHYTADNMRLALKQIRDEQGPDAIILSSRRLARGVEVTVALYQADQPVKAAANEVPATDTSSTEAAAAAVQRFRREAGGQQGRVQDIGSNARFSQSTHSTQPSHSNSRSSENPFADAQQLDKSVAGNSLKGSSLADSSLEASKASPLERGLEELDRSHQARAKALAKSLQRQSADEAAPPSAKGAQAESEFTLPDLKLDEALAADEVDIQHATAVAREEDFAASMAAVQAGIDALPANARQNNVTEEVTQLREELQSMRDMLEQQLSSMAWGSYRQQQPQRASLWRRLKRMGLSATVSQELLAELPALEFEKSDRKVPASAAPGSDKAQWQLLMEHLTKLLPTLEEDVTEQGGVFALVGATGAGKTTTIGKLATRYVLNHGADQVALVTTDTARIAAYEQLRTFGRILNVPVKVVDRNTSLEQVLYTLRHKSLVLIDTAGLNPQDHRQREQLELLKSMSNRIKTLLVLPATTQAAVAKASYHSYKSIGLTGCIMTKLDEAVSLGEVLSLATNKRLPIAYTTNGQAIPHDLAVANSYALVRAAIALAKPVVVNDDVMADDVSLLQGG